MLPQIVVIAFNRPKSLQRLLNSIAYALYPEKQINLTISIDGNTNTEVKNIAELFEWKHGNKEIIVQKQRLGLKQHICKVCDLAALKGDFIVLEDDISVSKYFYQFAVSAINFYREDTNVAGISLYSYSIAESCLMPFKSLKDEYDNYFIKFPSSWGQCFTTRQWNEFRSNSLKINNTDILLPAFINDWKKNSWKKDFAAFMIQKNKFFVFPKISTTTNFSEKGTNYPFKIDIFQVPLQLEYINYNFQKFADSDNKFDENFELLSNSVKKIIPRLADIDFAVDIYRTKKINTIKEQFIITTRSCTEKKFFSELDTLFLSRTTNSIGLCETNKVNKKTLKPDFGASIYLHSYNGSTNSMRFHFNFFVYKVKFTAMNYLHWIKNYIREQM